MVSSKILWKGMVFHPTGIATASREIIKELVKKGYQVQTDDIWTSKYEFNKGLENLNHPIDPDENSITIFADYPQYWQNPKGRAFGLFLHEGTKIPDNWHLQINNLHGFCVPSKATKNLFKWNNVICPIHVVPYGVNELYKPKEFPKDENFLFLSVNSWTGKEKDRKGIDVLVKAFDEEFKDEKVKLILKIGTFYRLFDLKYYVERIIQILGHTNDNIIVNCDYMPEEALASVYQQSDCFVMPTRGEAFGLTALNAMACGLPLIITKDNNSGHMDFVRYSTGEKMDSVLYIDTLGMEQADREFFVEGNLQPIIDKESLKKQMRYAFEHHELKEKALINSEIIRKWTWENSAEKLLEVING